MEKKYYAHLVGKEVCYEGETYKVTSAYEYVGVDDSTLWYGLTADNGSFAQVDSWDCTEVTDCVIDEGGLAELADMCWEDIDIMEDMIYEMGYSVV